MLDSLSQEAADKSVTVDVSEALKALNNPTRLAILGWLKDPRKSFPEQDIDPEQVGVCVSIIQERVGLSQSTVSLYLSSLQRAQLVTSQRIGSWTYYKRHEKNITDFLKMLHSLI
ncbi:ArsR/SmtB family transcription factor [Rhodococcus sp. M8-35]|uniref:ArsR/SmtB family transcription factor n=1 Tax=Rhodococcus sp. M8-35 TaxID=3058401 RepID=UPI002ED55EAF